MSEYTLIIGNKNFSTWSLRGYLALKHAEVDFDEIIISLRPSHDKETLKKLTPAGKVPALIHGNHIVWDSLAIAEYLNDLFPQKAFWPNEINLRAHARSISSEMHSGFSSLRSKMPMACHSIFETPEMTDDLKTDIDRIKHIWSECLNKYNHLGPYLFGRYSIADMMFAPVVFRFKSYQVKLTEKLQNYCDEMIQLPAVQQWQEEVDSRDL
ncbi:MAG: glutathione S-transferase family protein [Proteobacteria bacterium]|jgi:glutathione S-transferase|nr:glutathione S-transferase family protein [Pseudomonadota bacterium]